MFAGVLAACASEDTEEAGGSTASAVTVTDEQVANALHGRLRPLSSVPRVAASPAAVRLGKALFWDVQAGSDGKTACATCHYSAGADARVINTIAPGPDGRFASNGVTGPGQVAQSGNIGTDDRVGSQGVSSAQFVRIDPESAAEECVATLDPTFGSERRVTGRNAPSVIGASFYRTLFWDGRADSLAAQARGPILSDVEMSCAHRSFDDLAAKLLPRRPLALQTIDPDDSVLGAVREATYRELVVAAYGPDASFAAVWGDAIAAYEATLVPDETPLDRYLAGDHDALTGSEKWGLVLFATRGRCIECHDGAELSDATSSYFEAHGAVNDDGGEQGFHNVGVRPVSDLGVEDLGRAAIASTPARADRGAFKTPMLRNAKLTAPYFHNGGKATLKDVVNAYRGPSWGDYPHTSTVVRQVSLLDFEVPPLVELLERGLTDCRVENERAPFDHPSLDVPNGPRLPAVGKDGRGACP